MKTLSSKKLSLFSITICLMLIIGLIVEMLIPGPILATYISPSPAEGMLIFLVMILGYWIGVAGLITYLLILLMVKGPTPLFIGEIALTISAISIISFFAFFNSKLKLSFFKSAILTIILNTLLMIVLNAYFILPTYLNIGKGTYTTYKTIFINQSFWQVMVNISKPIPIGGGIVHGTLIKYFSCFWLAHKAYGIYKIRTKKR